MCEDQQIRPSYICYICFLENLANDIGSVMGQNGLTCKTYHSIPEGSQTSWSPSTNFHVNSIFNTELSDVVYITVSNMELTWKFDIKQKTLISSLHLSTYCISLSFPTPCLINLQVPQRQRLCCVHLCTPNNKLICWNMLSILPMLVKQLKNES